MVSSKKSCFPCRHFLQVRSCVPGEATSFPIKPSLEQNPLYNVCVTIIKISFSSWCLPCKNDISHFAIILFLLCAVLGSPSRPNNYSTRTSLICSLSSSGLHFENTENVFYKMTALLRNS